MKIPKSEKLKPKDYGEDSFNNSANPMNSEEEIRQAFEKVFPLPKELFWDESNKTYNTMLEFTMMSQYIHTFIGFQAGLSADKLSEEIGFNKGYKKAQSDCSAELTTAKKRLGKMDKW